MEEPPAAQMRHSEAASRSRSSPQLQGPQRRHNTPPAAPAGRATRLRSAKAAFHRPVTPAAPSPQREAAISQMLRLETLPGDGSPALLHLTAAPASPAALHTPAPLQHKEGAKWCVTGKKHLGARLPGCLCACRSAAGSSHVTTPPLPGGRLLQQQEISKQEHHARRPAVAAAAAGAAGAAGGGGRR